MMDYHFNWHSLDKTADGLNGISARRIYELSQYDIFIIKNNRQQYGLLIQLNENYSKKFKIGEINVNALSIDFNKMNNRYGLFITLLDTNDLSIFDHFTFFLFKGIDDCRSELRLIQQILMMVKQWQRFLHAASKNLLTDMAIQGLIAELSQLDEWLVNEAYLNQSQILEAWKGPEQLQHDFIFDNAAFEIKSVSSLDKNKVLISSEHQLESFTENLYLSVYKVLKVLKNDLRSITLNELVDRVKSHLHTQYHDLFMAKLLEVGYINKTEYDQQGYIIEKLADYIVNDEFPKITTMHLPIGIHNIRYEIDLNVIEKFKVIENIKIL